MRVVRLPETGVAEAWREAARDLASRGVPGAAVEWVRGDAAASLFGDGGTPVDGPTRALKVPRGFVDLAEKVTHHSDPQRFARLYELLLRLQERPRLLEDVADSGVARIMAMRKSVRRDMHKMTAFVRFREVEADVEARAAAVLRVVRAGASDHRDHGAVFRAAVRRHGLDDRDAASVRAVRGRGAGFPAGGGQAGGGRRSDRGAVADVLSQHLQSGAAEGGGDALGDAEEVLEEPAGGGA